ncbi:MAG: pyridoxamine 5'-phosphate oxidase family protein [Actinomycetota bacterium]|nr:pyridoxamine 5'-phosphate oxidase family protein [Actinomycetota bacterium]
MSDKTQIGRLPERGVTDREVLNSILDEGIVCHVAYVVDDRPVGIPTLYVRAGDRILVHGSNSAGFVRAARDGKPLCVTVTHLDGIVVARSGFHSSANYRSAVIHGTGRVLEGEEHWTGLDLTVEGLIPGRASDLRSPSESESKQTSVIEIMLDEWSVKTRSGGPGDDPADMSSDAWAGVVPLSVVAGDPIPSEDLADGIEVPDYLSHYSR